MKPMTWLLLTATALSLSACGNTLRKLDQIGEQPPLTKVENPQTRSDYKPLSWPLPDPEGATTRTSNSLWQPGARGFFRDQRATRVGDILKVNVSIADSAKFDNTSNANRTTADNTSINALGGLEAKIGSLIPFKGVSTNPANLLDVSGNTQTNSTGKIDRKETIKTQVAALVTQVLPNGNLVIEGTQEILVNFEVREISVRGVIRPQDITSENSVDSAQIAQARIVYSGRGRISDIEQPRWGSQAVEILSPF
ncbi:MAG: flagellar basal body L-ring protein FlgH [Alphaproteobacteria bacterium]|nr:flagellar basal body L-ring protein FlgH [Alphaproteobacteria bacterium]